MKKISIKLMGVVLTLALLAGLVMAAVPVSAGNMTWTNYKMPKLTEATDANVFAVSDDGSVIYLYDGTKLNKSTDGGATWDDELEIPTTGDPATPITITAIAIFPDNPEKVLITDGVGLWSSKNGGDSFKSFGTFAGAINSIDVGGEDGGIIVAVATADGVYLYDDEEGDWYTPTETGWDATEALLVAVSPNYADDAVVVAVSAAGEDDEEEVVYSDFALRTLFVDFDRPETMLWDEDVAEVEAPDDVDAVSSIALPSDFDSASEFVVFVGGNDVYRVTDEEWTDLGAGLGDITSIAYTGTVDDGTLVAANDDAEIKTSTQAGTDDDPDWTKADKNPSGTDAVLAFAGTDKLYAGTASTGSALYVATADTDFGSFDGIAFISVPDLDLVTFKSSVKGAGTDNLFQIIKVGDADIPDNMQNMIFASTDAGKTWKVIYNVTSPVVNPTVNIDNIYITRNYAEDKTIYIYQGSDFYRYIKSEDGGQSWNKAANLVSKTNATSFSLIDANSYWVGSEDGVQRSDWSDAVEIADGETVAQIFAFPDFMVVTTQEGSVAASTDGGNTFEVLGEKGLFTGFPAASATFDVPNKTIYAQYGTGNVEKWIVGTSDDWASEVNYADFPAELTATGISSLSLASDGVWYITSRGNPNGQVWRSADLKGENFEAVPGSNFSGTIAAGPQTVYKDANGASVLLQTIVGGSYTDNKYPVVMRTFTQSVGDAPTTVAPAANASVPRNVDFTWNKVDYTGTVKYELQIAYDADFNNIVDDHDYSVANNNAISGNMKSVSGLPAGKTLYWRVRVAPDNPIASKWSPAVQFQTKVVSANLEDGITARLAPASGATGVSTMPALTWGAVAGASGYNFEIATDAGFTQIVESKTGLTGTAMSPAQPLKPGTVYFWRVQAVDGANVGDWVVSAFTTAAEAAPSTTTSGPIATQSPVTVPPATVVVNQAPPTTPAYIWVIIAIGAVLVIAVIVLIARTRRV